MNKKLLMWSLPVVVAVAPVAAFSGKDWWAKLNGSLRGLAPASASRGPLLSAGAPVDPGTGPDQAADPLAMALPRPENAAAKSLDEIFRFDVNSGWVISQWPRVSAGLAEMRLQGYRVALVSGTSPDDLAGALTYYFNARQQAQRITFQGTTGDPGKLVQFLSTRYGFARRVSGDPRLVRYEVMGPKNEPVSYLDVRPSEVIKAEDAYRRYQLTLKMEREEK